MAGQASPTNYYASLRRQLEHRAQLVKAFDTVPVYQSVPNAPNVQYCGSTKWTAVAAWAATTAYTAGNLVRQLATPTVGFERVFLCISPGTSGGSEPLWSTPATAPAYGSAWNDGTVQWVEVTGRSAYGWFAPHARLANALTVPWCAPGDYVYVSNNHAESQSGAITLTFPGTMPLPNVVLCVNDAGSVPPTAADLRATATVTSTAGGVSFGSCAHCYGIGFVSGSNSTMTFGGGVLLYLRLESCSLFLNSSNGGNVIQVGGSGGLVNQYLELINTTVRFGATGQSLQPTNCRFRWENTPSAISAAGSVPTVLLFSFSGRPAIITVNGVDLSALVAGSSLVDASALSPSDYTFQDCKLGSSVSMTANAVANRGAMTISAVNCDSANTNYRYFKQNYQGTITHETTVVRTGGASDGTTTISRKMISSANSLFYSPLESDPITFWNESTSPITVTVPILVDAGGGAVPATGLTNKDAWIEVEYPGTSGFPLGVYDIDSRASNFLSLPAAQSVDGTSVWVNALSAPVQQSLSSTLTPTGKGPIRVKVMLARPNTTIWFDPLVILS